MFHSRWLFSGKNKKPRGGGPVSRGEEDSGEIGDNDGGGGDGGGGSGGGPEWPPQQSVPANVSARLSPSMEVDAEHEDPDSNSSSYSNDASNSRLGPQ